MILVYRQFQINITASGELALGTPDSLGKRGERLVAILGIYMKFCV